MDSIIRLFGEDSAGIQFLRFIDYVDRKDNFRYTIVLVFTRSESELRERIFEMASVVVAATGWYPLVAGSRMASVMHLENLAATIPRADEFAIDVGSQLRRIEPAVPPEGGCAIRVVTDRASVLLDTGFPGLSPEASDQLALVTHHHDDHIGSALTSSFIDLPIITSLGSAAMATLARGLNRMPPNFYVWDLAAPLAIGNGISMSMFAVPHTPGSTGFILADERNAIIYTGDVCIRTGRHDFTQGLAAVLERYSDRNTTLLLDATMANRNAGASLSTAANLLSAAGGAPDIVLLARTPDHLLYAYLDLFFYLRADGRETTEFMCDPLMRGVFQLIHASFIKRAFHNIDPFLHAQYQGSMHAWAESRWLYWLDETAGSRQTDRRRIWFLSNRCSYKGIELRPGVTYAVIGKFGERPQGVDGCKELDADTTPWTLHSSNDTLIDTIGRLSGDTNIVLFHNFAGRLRSFIRKNALRAAALGDTGLDLD